MSGLNRKRISGTGESKLSTVMIFFHASTCRWVCMTYPYLALIFTEAFGVSNFAIVAVVPLMVAKEETWMASRGFLSSNGRGVLAPRDDQIRELTSIAQEAFLLQLLGEGFMHCDPHPGEKRYSSADRNYGVHRVSSREHKI